LQQS